MPTIQHHLKLKNYAKLYPNPRLEELYSTIERMYDYWGNMIEMNSTAKYGMDIACDTSKPFAMRVDGVNLASKILRKNEHREQRAIKHRRMRKDHRPVDVPRGWIERRDFKLI